MGMRVCVCVCACVCACVCVHRMELVERARAAAAKQTIEKAAQNVDATVNARLNPW